MFDDENDNDSPGEKPADPVQRANEKADEFRMHAQLAAVFEAVRKFDAQLKPGLDPELAREIQRTMGKLEKAKSPESPILPPTSADDAAHLLNVPDSRSLSTNDYHISRRPGEVLIVRWIQGRQVDSFYQRLQAHFDVAMDDFRSEEKANLEWKQDADSEKYLKALDSLQVKMEDRYLRPLIRQHKLFVLSTQTADEIDILHLCDYVMGVDSAQVVGPASAPPEDSPTEQDRAWFFKLFSLRGLNADTEQMCFFTYLQKSEEGW